MFGTGRRRQAEATARYLDSLLAPDAARAADVPAAGLDPAVHLAARRLRADVVRFHPSFRFQEDLAARLAFEGERMRRGQRPDVEPSAAVPAGSVAHASILRFPIVPAWARDRVDTSASEPAEPAEPDEAPEDEPGADAEPAAHRGRDARPYIVGGVASAAISLGAAYVAWRWTRPSEGAMVRAVRAAHAAHAASATAAVTAAASVVASAAAGATAGAPGATVTGAASTTSVLAAAARSTIGPHTSARHAVRARRRSVLQGLLGVVA